MPWVSEKDRRRGIVVFTGQDPLTLNFRALLIL
jgi:hypothetical protein